MNKKNLLIFYGAAGSGKSISLLKYVNYKGQLESDDKSILLATNDDYNIGVREVLKEVSKICNYSYKVGKVKTLIPELLKSDKDNIYFDFHFRWNSCDIVSVFKIVKNCKLKYIFVINVLHLPYKSILNRWVLDKANEVIVTFMDFYMLLSLSEKKKIDDVLKEIINEKKVYFTNGPSFPNGFYETKEESLLNISDYDMNSVSILKRRNSDNR